MPKPAATAPSPPSASLEWPDAPADVIARLDPIVLRVFAEEDFHRVDMRSIAREAGMSFGTIYRYFRDKEALLFWFITYWLRDLYPAALETLNTDESALVRLQNCLLAHLRFYEVRPEVGRVIFMTVPLERWMRDSSYKANTSARRLLAVIAEGQEKGEIRKDISKVLVFDAWSGVFNRAFLMWEFRKRSYSLTGQWGDLCKLFVGGIAGPSAEPESVRPPAKPRKHRAPARPSE